MELRDIIESGILELYVLNQLSEKERLEVEGYIEKYPELSKEIEEIEKGFFALGKSMEASVSPDAKNQLLDKIRNKPGAGHVRTGGSSFSPWYALLIAGIIGILLLWYLERNENSGLQEELAELRSTCDSLQNEQATQLAVYEQLYHPENRILAFEATENYPSARLYFHHNEATNKNFIQVLDLPEISDDQSFQLWSLKEDQAPAPLDVFEGQENLFEVDYIPGSNAYAITIEERGGAQTPNLEQLIGVVNISG
ncbi:MAG: anti-sigma factor [Saprospiraceae bacterium]|nr:anti-sigma factor [Saprospiraceae bacterium]